MSIATVVRAEGASDMPLGKRMNEIREWLDSQKITPVAFKTLVGSQGLEFEISFRHEHEADQFQQRFSSLVG